MNIQDLNGKLAVITGGSSGIGYCVAEQLARHGCRLLLAARDINNLQHAADKLSKVSVHKVNVVSVDIANARDIDKLKLAVENLAPAADIVINSAGVVSCGKLDETPYAEWQRLYSLNVAGVVQILQALLPAMRVQSKHDKQQRHIVNIASAAGLMGFPGMSAYSATKGAVISLSECMRSELRHTPIGVTAVCPSFVQTPIASKIQIFGSMLNPKTQQRIKEMFAADNLTPEKVALATLQAIAKNQGLLVVGKQAKIAYLIKRLSPYLFEKFVTR